MQRISREPPAHPPRLPCCCAWLPPIHAHRPLWLPNNKKFQLQPCLPCKCSEVQRILMELLTQMDGFEQNTNVKVRGR